MRISAAEGVYTGCVRGEAEPPMAQQVFFFFVDTLGSVCQA